MVSRFSVGDGAILVKLEVLVGKTVGVRVPLLALK
jgi:hypothetical protein